MAASGDKPPTTVLFESSTGDASRGQNGKLVFYDWIVNGAHRTWRYPVGRRLPWPAPITLTGEDTIRIGLEKAGYPDDAVVALYDRRPRPGGEQSGREAVLECANYPALDIAAKSCWLIPRPGQGTIGWDIVVKLPWRATHLFVGLIVDWPDEDQGGLPTDERPPERATYLFHGRFGG